MFVTKNLLPSDTLHAGKFFWAFIPAPATLLNFVKTFLIQIASTLERKLHRMGSGLVNTKKNKKNKKREGKKLSKGRRQSGQHATNFFVSYPLPIAGGKVPCSAGFFLEHF